MFLWVTDFYSLEKIISAFPKIVLLYLKMTGVQTEGGCGYGGKIERGGGAGLRRFVQWERGKKKEFIL